MVAFNFRAADAAKVLSGEKNATIRPTKRSKPGDTLQLYTGLRTRKTKLLKIAKCVDVRKIEIYKDSIEGVEDFDTAEFMQMLGYEGMELEEFTDLFAKYYTFPYIGYLYIWADIRDNSLKANF